MAAIGLFGKLPVHGDFIERQLASTFTGPWDEWLQLSIASSKEMLGASWMDKYLSSPIWRFCLSSGCIDEQVWGGILMPSVDSVGRYFPLTLASPIQANANLFEFMSHNEKWFQLLEQAALNALQQGQNADYLQQNLQHAAACVLHNCEVIATPGFPSQAVVAFGRGQFTTRYEQLLHSQFSTYASYSVWSCQAGEHVYATTLACPGLPRPGEFTALLDGNWNRWNWQR